jgi:hypothetical protein
VPGAFLRQIAKRRGAESWPKSHRHFVLRDEASFISRKDKHFMRSRKAALIRAVPLLLLFTASAWPSSLDTWTVRNPQPTANTLFAITYGNGQFVAVGDLGTIITSPDGANWAVRQSGTTNRLAAVAYGNGQFVTVSGNPWAYSPSDQTGVVLVTSPDGITWNQQPMPRRTPIQAFSSLVFGNGRFVLADEQGLLTSSDGATWEPTLHEALDPQSVGIKLAYGNGQFVGFFQDQLITSADGINWAYQGLTNMAATNGPITVVAYGGGRFVAKSGNGETLGTNGQIVSGGILYSSSDGTNWVRGQPQSDQFLAAAAGINALTYGSGQFVAVGYGNAFTSVDGVNWVQQDLPSDFSGLYGAAYANDRFVAVGGAGFITTSGDGVNWLRQSGSNQSLGSIAYGNGQFVAVSSWPANGSLIMTSPDGANWTYQTPTTNLFSEAVYSSSLAFGNGQFVRVGDRGTILTSTNGISWYQGSSGTTNDLQAIAFAGDRFVAVGWEGSTLLTSTNGTDWDQLKPPSGFYGYNGFSMAYGNGRFVMVGWEFAATSTNGVDWVQQPLPVDGYPANSIAFGNGQFVLVGGCEICWPQVPDLTSLDGASWTVEQGTESTLNAVTSVAFGGGRFVAVGGWDLGPNTRIIMTSADGVHWDRLESSSSSLWSVAYGNGHFVAVGNFETILESGPIIDLVLSCQRNPGLISLSLEGPTASEYTVQQSRDLVSWQSLTNLNTGQSGKGVLTLPATSGHVFYQALSQ